MPEFTSAYKCFKPVHIVLNQKPINHGFTFAKSLTAWLTATTFWFLRVQFACYMTLLIMKSLCWKFPPDLSQLFTFSANGIYNCLSRAGHSLAQSPLFHIEQKSRCGVNRRPHPPARPPHSDLSLKSENQGVMFISCCFQTASILQSTATPSKQKLKVIMCLCDM